MYNGDTIQCRAYAEIPLMGRPKKETETIYIGEVNLCRICKVLVEHCDCRFRKAGVSFEEFVDVSTSFVSPDEARAMTEWEGRGI